jgi:hypothetical protein
MPSRSWMGKNYYALELYPFWDALYELDVTVFVYDIPQRVSTLRAGHAGMPPQ